MIGKIAISKALLCLAALGVCSNVPAAAQGAQAPSAPQTQPPGPSEPTPAQIALGRELVTAIGADKPFLATVDDFKQQILLGLSQTRPDLVRELGNVLNQIKPEFDKRTEEVITASARIYAKNFSESELKQILEFFKSPVGKRYVEVQPRALAEIYAYSQAWSRKMSEDMVTRTREEMRKKGLEF